MLLFHMSFLVGEEVILVVVKKKTKIIVIIILSFIISANFIFINIHFTLKNAEKDAEYILKNQYYDVCEKISSKFNIQTREYSIIFLLKYENEYKRVIVDLKSKDTKGQYNRIKVEEYVNET